VGLDVVALVVTGREEVDGEVLGEYERECEREWVVCGDEDLFMADLFAGAGLASSMALKYSAPMAEWSWLISLAS